MFLILWEFDTTFWSYSLPSSSQIHTLLPTLHFESPTFFFFFKNRLYNIECPGPSVLQPSTLLFWDSPWALVGAVSVLIGARHPMLNCSLHFARSQPWATAPIRCKTQLLWWGTAAPLICGQTTDVKRGIQNAAVDYMV